MTRAEFENLFRKEIAQAIKNAESRLGQAIPKEIMIEFHGAGTPNELINQKTAINRLYLGSDQFYRIIDLSVISVKDNKTIIFLRVSDHKPGRFENTWNQPPGSGPFKHLIASQIATN